MDEPRVPLGHSGYHMQDLLIATLVTMAPYLDDLARDVAGRTPEALGRLLVQANPLPGAVPGAARQGMRLTVQEATRRAMDEADMALLAGWFRRVALDGEGPERVGREVAAAMRAHARVAYSFDREGT
jgi:hypothetical protein